MTTFFSCVFFPFVLKCTFRFNHISFSVHPTNRTGYIKGIRKLYGKKARENDSEGTKKKKTKKYCGTILLGAVFSHRHRHSVTLYFFHHFLTFSSFSFSSLLSDSLVFFHCRSSLCFHGLLSVTNFLALFFRASYME